MLDIQLFVEREDEADHGVEHGHRPLHQLLEQLAFRPQGVERAADIVERLELQ